MDSVEHDEKLKRHEAFYANYLKAKYFSDKDIYGGIYIIYYCGFHVKLVIFIECLSAYCLFSEQLSNSEH